MKKIYNEFKTFISRGNVVDLAVAFILGAAFKDILNSLLNDIIIPVITLLVGNDGLNNLKYVVIEATETTQEVAINYGIFLSNILEFFLIAIVVFTVIKLMNSLQSTLSQVPDKVEQKIDELKEIITKEKE